MQYPQYSWYLQYPSQLPYLFATPKLYLNFLFWYSFYLYLFSTALTTPSTLGGCVTDYQYRTKMSFCLTHVPPCFLTLYVLLLIHHRRQSLATYFMYLYHLISIDLQSSRSCNALRCKNLQSALRFSTDASHLAWSGL